MRIIIQRDEPLERVVFGKWFMPWIQHHPDIYTIVPFPAIPAGIYQLLGHDTPKHPRTWEVANVPGHTGILIHSGNFACDVVLSDGTYHATDSENCILPGFGINESIPMVLNSNKCIDYLRTTIGVKPHGKPTNIELEIRNA